MRIRSTKPEFWRSETIAALDWDARLILKGVESYVDDNGVGKDSVILICADVFPHDLARDPETVARVSRGLQALCDAQIIARYTMHGERLLYVRRWKTLQRVDRPNKGRHPRPDGTLEYSENVDESVCAGLGASDPETVSDSRHPREDIATPSRGLHETPSTGTGEQRNRGTEEKESCGAVLNVSNDRTRDETEAPPRGPAVDTSGWRIVREEISDDHPHAVRTDLAMRVGGLLKAGTPEGDVRSALALWLTKPKLGPGTLPSLVSEVVKARTAPSSNGSHLTPREAEFVKAELMKDNPNPEVLRRAGVELPTTYLTALPGGRS